MPLCVVTEQPIEFFPGVCVALQHYLFEKFRGDMRTRKNQDEKALFEKYGLQMPNISDTPDEEGEEGFRQEMCCVVDDELAFAPCSLSSGNIVS